MTLPISAKSFIPQQYPFQFVDTLVAVEQNKTIATYKVSHDCVLLEENMLSEMAYIEILAQTAAAGSGFYFTQANQKIPTGYIGAVKKFQLHATCTIESELISIVETKNSIGNASIVEGKIMCKNECIASAELTIFVNN
ncbi:MAG: hypothetical protein R2831_12940 [Chitinophagaceae bacterium]